MSRSSAAALAVVPLALFAVLALSVPGDGGGLAWDGPVARFVDDLVPVSSEEVHADPVMLGLVLAIAAPAGLLGLAYLLRRRLRAALHLAGTVAAAALLALLAQVAVARPAIEGEGHSFPSGTAALTAAIVAAVLLLSRPGRARRLLGLGGAVFLLVHGGAIVFEEWHYPSDVLAGWALALACALVVWAALGRPSPGVPG